MVFEYFWYCFDCFVEVLNGIELMMGEGDLDKVEYVEVESQVVEQNDFMVYDVGGCQFLQLFGEVGCRYVEFVSESCVWWSVVFLQVMQNF